jgi:hypothetical protein
LSSGDLSFENIKILHDELLYDKAGIPTRAIYDV